MYQHCLVMLLSTYHYHIWMRLHKSIGMKDKGESLCTRWCLWLWWALRREPSFPSRTVAEPCVDPFLLRHRHCRVSGARTLGSGLVIGWLSRDSSWVGHLRSGGWKSEVSCCLVLGWGQVIQSDQRLFLLPLESSSAWPTASVQEHQSILINSLFELLTGSQGILLFLV